MARSEQNIVAMTSRETPDGKMTASGADIIARRLYAAGCRHAFGIPGGEVLAIMDGLASAGIAFHLTKHENAAGFMAEGSWHATGAPGILVATIGPGFANCVNVIANAHQDRVPMIVLTGKVDAAEAETYTHQVIDHQAVIRPVVKATLTASAGAVDVVIAKAISIALSGQPGPVHIDVPITVAELLETVTTPAVAPRLAPMAPMAGEMLSEARAALAKAKRPLVIAGVDAVNQGAAAAVTAFCTAMDAPLITTYKGKGLLPEDDALALGGHGLSPKADKILLPLIAQADCIILAGYDPIEMRTGWRHPWSADVPVISFCAVAPIHFMHAETMTFIGDVGAGLAALSDDSPSHQGWPDDAPAKAKRALAVAFAPEPEWGPGVVFSTVRRLAPPETVVSVDSGAHRILISQMWPCPSPRTMIQSTGFCTMASALPLAIGHKIARPDVPVLAVMGDAGFEMVLGELATLRDLNLPVVILVLVDEALALIDLKQRAMQKPRVGVTFGATDFAAVARAFGGNGVFVSDVPALEAAWQAAVADKTRFSVIAARIDQRAYDGKF